MWIHVANFMYNSLSLAKGNTLALVAAHLYLWADGTRRAMIFVGSPLTSGPPHEDNIKA